MASSSSSLASDKVGLKRFKWMHDESRKCRRYEAGRRAKINSEDLPGVVTATETVASSIANRARSFLFIVVVDAC